MQQEVMAALLPYVDGGKPVTPELSYVDWEAMLADIQAIETVRMGAMLARERQLQDEDDEEVVLLAIS
jgi:hypothetical protein